MIDKETAVEMRLQGHTYPEIQKALGCSKSWCVVNLGKVTPREEIFYSRKNDLSPLLDNSLESFYWLGFLFADGHFSDKGRLQVSVAEKDANHLEKLANYLSIKEIRKYKVNRNNYVAISAMHKTVMQQLSTQYSILSDKTTQPCNIDSIEGDNLFALSIGFIDGDGSIRKVTNREHPFMSIKCHSSWLENVKKMLPQAKTKINSSGYTESRISDTSVLKEMKIKALELQLPLMDRKWCLVDTNFTSREERVRNCTPQIESMLDLGYSKQRITDLFGISLTPIYRIDKERKQIEHLLDQR